MSYMELIEKIMADEMGSSGKEIVEKQMENMGVNKDTIGPENIPALAKGISEAVVSLATREKGKKVYWELLKLLDIESIVAGTEDPSLKAAQLADMGDASCSTGEWEKAREYYNQISATGAPGVEPLVLIKMGELHATKGEQKEAREYFKRASEMAARDGNYLLEALALRGIGYTSWRIGEYPQAIDLFSRAITVALQVDDIDMAAQLYTDMGLVHQATGLYDKALGRFKEAIKILTETGNMDELARACNNFGEAYKEKGDLDKALEAYGQCVDAASKVKNDRLRALALVNSAECYAKMGRLDEAKKTAEESIKALEGIDDEYIMSGAYLALALVASKEKDWPTMEEYFNKEIDILQRLGYKQDMALNMVHYAKALVEKGDTESAKENFLKAKKIFVELASTGLLDEVETELEKLEKF